MSSVSAPRVEDARGGVDGLHRPDPRPDALGDDRRRGVDQDPRVEPPGGRRDAPRDEGDDGLVGQVAWLERRSDGHVRPQPIDPERPPVDPVGVPGDQVPAPAGVDQAMRLDPALARAAVPVVVVEAQLAADRGRPRPASSARPDRPSGPVRWVTSTVCVWRAVTRLRSRTGRTCSSLASARSDDSSMPVTAPPAPVRSPTASATASSSSSSNGGSVVPAASR